MKEFWRYKTFNYLIASLVPVIACIFIKVKDVRIMLLSFSIILFLFCAVLFLSEFHNSKKIQKDGVFVMGVLEKDSIKTHVYMKDLYILKARVKYYDEQRKMTLRFQGYDICSSWEIGFGKVKEIRDRDEDVEVMVGYLVDNPVICDLYLKEAFERTY